MCTAGFWRGYNSKGVGGREGYVYAQGLLQRTHTFEEEMEGLRILVRTTVDVWCNGQFSSRYNVLDPGIYPLDTTDASCVAPVQVRYPVDAEMDRNVTDAYLQCITCERGKYSPANGSTACLRCPAGKFQNKTGATSCVECLVNTQEGSSTCTPCRPGLIFRDGQCRPCPDGQFYPLFLDGVCLDCPANMWSDQTSAGCQNCPLYSSSKGGTNLTGCLCIDGRALSTNVQNTPLCLECPIGSYGRDNQCTLCANGTFSSVQRGASACTACPPGTISSRVGASICTPCPLGFTSTPSDRTRCFLCPAGRVCAPGSEMVSCPLGTYSLATGLTSVSQCPLCPRNYACGSPTTIDPCPEHTTSPEGSVNRHQCVCDPGYKCDYFFSTSGELTLSIGREQFETSRQALIEQIARAAGVDPSQVEIIEVSGT